MHDYYQDRNEKLAEINKINIFFKFRILKDKI